MTQVRGRRVAVLGGGWAGMAAAVELADAGARVKVLEAAPTLGGRARTVEYRGLALDNGAHILIGAYRQTLDSMRKVGVEEAHGQLQRSALDLHYPGRFRLRAPRLSRPLHLLAALLCARGLPWKERLATVRFMRAAQAMRFELPQDTTVERLLVSHTQGPCARRYLWEPLCMAALNTPVGEASAQVFLNVLRDSLNGAPRDSDLLLPRCDLSRLFPLPAAEYVRKRGGAVLTGCRVRAVRIDGAGFGIEHSLGQDTCDAVVCALPPFRVPEALATLPDLSATLRDIEALEYEPIHCVYLQFDTQVRLPQAMLGLDRSLAQWVFDRGALTGQPGLVCALISARGAHEALSQQQLASRIAEELVGRFPQLHAPRWTRVIAEKRATFSCRPGLARPDQRTRVPGLVLAGDYTASPYPGTLEAAERSGARCARLLAEGNHVLA